MIYNFSNPYRRCDVIINILFLIVIIALIFALMNENVQQIEYFTELNDINVDKMVVVFNDNDNSDIYGDIYNVEVDNNYNMYGLLAINKENVDVPFNTIVKITGVNKIEKKNVANMEYINNLEYNIKKFVLDINENNDDYIYYINLTDNNSLYRHTLSNKSSSSDVQISNVIGVEDLAIMKSETNTFIYIIYDNKLGIIVIPSDVDASELLKVQIQNINLSNYSNPKILKISANPNINTQENVLCVIQEDDEYILNEIEFDNGEFVLTSLKTYPIKSDNTTNKLIDLHVGHNSSYLGIQEISNDNKVENKIYHNLFNNSWNDVIPVDITTGSEFTIHDAPRIGESNDEINFKLPIEYNFCINGI